MSGLCSYLETAGRYNYTTPKSYLELIALYKNLLANKREELRGAKTRLENGVEKIAQASAQVCPVQNDVLPSQVMKATRNRCLLYLASVFLPLRGKLPNVTMLFA